MIDALASETTDKVGLSEARTRAAQLDKNSIKHHYKLAMRMGEEFLGEAEVIFGVVRILPEEDALWINVSVEAIASVYLNGTDLIEWASNK